MSDDERYVPTPKEVEKGLVKRRRLAEEEQEESQEQDKRGRFSLFRRLGVGGRRKYVKPEEVVTPSRPVQPSLDRQPPSSGQPPTAPRGRRVESVKVPSRRREEPAPKYARYSKEERFYEKALAKGHKMGVLVPTPFTANFEAFCGICGLRGELVVEREENYRNVTNDHSRGPAMERSCSGKQT